MTAAIAASLADQPWIAFARSKLGVREVAGDKDNPFIVECLRLAGLPTDMLHDETAWCGSFVNRCMRESGIAGPKGPAAARHWLNWGTPIGTFVPGCVGIWSRPPSPSSGHVGFPLAKTAGGHDSLSGNQNNSVCFKVYPDARLLGLRWPPGVPLP